MKSLFKNFFKKILKKINNRLFVSILTAQLIKNRTMYYKIKNLEDAELKIFSQNGEDGIIDYLLHSLNIHKPKFVEIGVGDYSEANTKFLYERTSAKGLIIDLEKNLFDKVKKTTNMWRGDLKVVETLINPENVNKILLDASFDKEVDLFSLDIDGQDYWILEKLPNNFTKILVCEYNPIFGPDHELTVPRNDNFRREKYHFSNLCYGMSLKAAMNLMKKKNFYFVGCNLMRNNAFFVHKDYIKNLNLDHNRFEDIKQFTNFNYREARDLNNKLTLLSGSKRLDLIKECEVENLVTKKIIKLKDLN